MSRIVERLLEEEFKSRYNVLQAGMAKITEAEMKLRAAKEGSEWDATVLATFLNEVAPDGTKGYQMYGNNYRLWHDGERFVIEEQGDPGTVTTLYPLPRSWKPQ